MVSPQQDAHHWSHPTMSEDSQLIFRNVVCSRSRRTTDMWHQVRVMTIVWSTLRRRRPERHRRVDSRRRMVGDWLWFMPRLYTQKAGGSPSRMTAEIEEFRLL